jgi:hypothetical protein
MKTKENIKKFKAGEAVVVIGSSTFDREVIVYQDPVSFVQTMNKTKVPNEQFMLKVSKIFMKLDVNLPHHSEEAFLAALIETGVCSAAILN